MDRAAAEGAFDDLPLAGQPLDLRDAHDPDWWVKRRLAAGDIEREALLPLPVLLRREAARLDDTLAAFTREEQVREYVADYNRRVRDDALAAPGPFGGAVPLDPEMTVARWRRVRGWE
ncbi:DUF1992 domain-containing protein [Brachybacterium sp. EF45031]|nr:DUF1992 domain-containing protein [Brachybacterium sillae]